MLTMTITASLNRSMQIMTRLILLSLILFPSLCFSQNFLSGKWIVDTGFESDSIHLFEVFSISKMGTKNCDIRWPDEGDSYFQFRRGKTQRRTAFCFRAGIQKRRLDSGGTIQTPTAFANGSLKYSPETETVTFYISDPKCESDSYVDCDIVKRVGFTVEFLSKNQVRFTRIWGLQEEDSAEPDAEN